MNREKAILNLGIYVLILLIVINIQTINAKTVPAVDDDNIPEKVFRAGDLGIAAIPFETFAETGLKIKAESPLTPSFTIELANGSYGYLPTPEQYKLGGYETWLGSSRVEIQASDKIVSKLLGLFKEIN